MQVFCGALLGWHLLRWQEPAEGPFRLVMQTVEATAFASGSRWAQSTLSRSIVCARRVWAILSWRTLRSLRPHVCEGARPKLHQLV